MTINRTKWISKCTQMLMMSFNKD